MVDGLVGDVQAVANATQPVNQRLAVQHVVFLRFGSLLIDQELERPGCRVGVLAHSRNYGLGRVVRLEL